MTTVAKVMLHAGLPMEGVSRLLTHKSIRVTEKYYAPWVRPWQELLDQHVIEAMRKVGTSVTV